MYEMAKKAREAMRGKAKRLAGEKDQKVDSSDWTPAEPLNADVKTGMRPLSPQGFRKSGAKAEGAKNAPRADRKARKSGGRAITADSLMNRDQKEANEDREGKKHIGGLKTGGRAKKALGGMPTDVMKQVRGQTMGFKKGGKAKKSEGGILDRVRDPNPSPDYSPKTDPNYRPPAGEGPSENEKAELKKKIEGRKAGGKVNFGPAENVGGKPGVSTKEQEKIEKHDQGLSKPKRGKAGHYADGGMPDPRMGIVDKNKLGGAPAGGSPYKNGGMAKHEDVAEDKALIKKMVKPSARTAKFGGGALSMPNMGPGKPGGYAAGGSPVKGKKGTNINIVINPGAPAADGGLPPGAPGMPPGGPGAPGGVPVPMGMPPAGGAPPAPMPMPMPMPMPAPAGGPPMGRKAGGKVYKSYKDMDAGAGSGLGRLEKTEIAKRKA